MFMRIILLIILAPICAFGQLNNICGRKCICALKGVRCVHLEKSDTQIEGVSPEVEGLIIGQSDVVFRKVNEKVNFLQLVQTSYTFSNYTSTFPNLRTVMLMDSVYRGFPNNNVTELLISNSQNLRGKQLTRVMKNVSEEFPMVTSLTLHNMKLQFRPHHALLGEVIRFPYLERLDLSGNDISTILVLNSIFEWWKLKQIVLNSNSISKIQLSDIKQISSLEFLPDARVKLEMKDNSRMPCSCALSDFQRWLKATELFGDPRGIDCQPVNEYPGIQEGSTSLLSVKALCSSSRKSTAVNLHGVGKMKGSVAALIVTGSVVGIIAICVLFCHHRRIGRAAKNVKNLGKASPYLNHPR